jgi:alkylation response protein AidB-like acyl-CoA dehydrogenase
MLTYTSRTSSTSSTWRRGGAEGGQGAGEVLIPIGKAGNTDMCVLIASEAMQVFGGYGYCADYPLEQFYATRRSARSTREPTASSRWT